MNTTDIITNNLATSIEAMSYFEGLETTLDRKISEMVQIEERLKKQYNIESALSTELAKNLLSDARGCNFTEYKSRNAALRLYCNYPVGYIYGEIQNNVPWTGKLKCFAVHAGRRKFNSVNLTQVGSFPEMSYPGWEALAPALLELLIYSTITEELLGQREGCGLD